MPTANQKRMIKHINATVFKLLNDYHFDKITIQKFVITQKLIVVHFIVISKINTTFYSLYPTISQLNFIMMILDLFFLQKNLFNNSSILSENIRKYLNIY